MMHTRPIFSTLLFAIVIAFVGGCQSPWPVGGQAQTLTPQAPAAQASAGSGTIIQTSATDPATLAMSGESSKAKTQEDAMAEVLSELEEIGAIDPGAKQQLLADLHEAKPENWSLIVQQFQSALAYRQQLATKELQQPASKPFAPHQSAPIQALPVTHEVSDKTVAAGPAVIHNRSYAEPMDTAVVVSDTATSEPTTPSEMALKAAKPLPKPSIASRPQAIAVAGPTQHKIKQVSYTAPATPARGWQEHVQAASAELEKRTARAPTSTAEVHDHMRLRMLRLLAGKEESAMSPIPGASSMQQDYWAKQLFAVSTFLDSNRQPDNKRRAAGSLMHLDQARANLSEMATLQIRNLIFVNSVEGYGVYEARNESKFRPGDQVILYTEVENFRSESTKEGYRTALGTSYAVIDTKGQRVENAQFPDVEDLCQNRRRDFHMQYGVSLPTRIYPGEYELRITITDQLSHKISQQSVPFEIVE